MRCFSSVRCESPIELRANDMCIIDHEARKLIPRFTATVPRPGRVLRLSVDRRAFLEIRAFENPCSGDWGCVSRADFNETDKRTCFCESLFCARDLTMDVMCIVHFCSSQLSSDLPFSATVHAFGYWSCVWPCARMPSSLHAWIIRIFTTAARIEAWFVLEPKAVACECFLAPCASCFRRLFFLNVYRL